MISAKNERGFIQFLLGNPLLLLSAALGIALVVCGLALKVKQAQYESEYKKRLQAESVVAQMVETAKQVADANARIVESWKQSLVRAKAAHANERSSLAAHIERMRDNPVRPDSTAIPVTSCPGAAPNGVSAQLVPAPDYFALQERAAYDALQVTQLQDYIRAIRSTSPLP